MKPNKDIHWELEQWAEWARRDHHGLGYPSMTGFRRLAGAPLDWEHDKNYIPVALEISEDRALKLDKLIASLDLDLRTVLYLYYYKKYDFSKTGKALTISREKASVAVKTACRVICHLEQFY